VDYADLTDLQKQVVECTCPTTLVLGGAGTGKTTTALWAARREIERQWEQGRDVRVLFLTFSRTATTRVAERAQSILVRGITDRVDIRTFHGFAYGVIAAFGRYAGLGSEMPEILTPAEAKLTGSEGRFTYADLLPHALRVLASPMIRKLYQARWSLMVCDEFQDTNVEQWELLTILTTQARLMTLADPNQMIYAGFIAGVSEQRISDAGARPRVHKISLPFGSHRDPSQLIPAAADAIRRRAFEDAAITSAVQAGRLTIDYPVPDGLATSEVVNRIETLKNAGTSTISVFVWSNQAVEEMTDALLGASISATPVGLSDAAIHAAAAQLCIAQAALGAEPWQEVRRALAVYLTSISAGNKAPEAAQRLYVGQSLPSAAQQQAVDALAEALDTGAANLEESLLMARQAWPQLRMTRGNSPWARAARRLGIIARAHRADGETDQLRALAGAVDELKMAALHSDEDVGDGTVQVMNMHQTKGREADATITVFEERYWVRRNEYDKGSRLLYVVLTRAREHCVVLVPPNPDHFIAPLAALHAYATGKAT
jgi:DNA helicase-2/ATP-dependent DNA helicase PcrA